MRRLGTWIAILLALAIAGKGIHWWESRAEGFRLHKIQEDIIPDSRWNLDVSSDEREEAKKILSQPFHYLGHGFQCYAFESQDGQYVVKFFRYQRLRLPSWIMALPEMPLFSEWRKTRRMTLNRRREYLLRSFKTSWQHAKEETALLYMQLNPLQEKTFPELTIQDSLGNLFRIQPDKYQFMLQRKAQHLKPTIVEHMQSGDLSGAQERISQIFGLLLHCAKRGVVDTDGALIRKNNMGFLGEKAIYIDGGKLRFHERLRSKSGFKKDLDRLRPLADWLHGRFPDLAAYFDQTIDSTIKEYDDFLSHSSTATHSDVR